VEEGKNTNQINPSNGKRQNKENEDNYYDPPKKREGRGKVSCIGQEMGACRVDSGIVWCKSSTMRLKSYREKKKKPGRGQGHAKESLKGGLLYRKMLHETLKKRCWGNIVMKHGRNLECSALGGHLD